MIKVKHFFLCVIYWTPAFFFCNLLFLNFPPFSYGVVRPFLFCTTFCFTFCFLIIYFIVYAITVVPFSPLYSPPPCTPPLIHIPPPSPFSSCPWVIHISSLASTFPIIFLTSPCLFSTYHLCYLFSVPCPPLSPSPLPC